MISGQILWAQAGRSGFGGLVIPGRNLPCSKSATTSEIWERGHLGLAKGSHNVEAAHWFVNRLISLEIQLELSKRAGNVPVNKRAIVELDKDPLAHEILRLSPNDIEHMRRVDFGKIDVSAWHDQWNQIMRR